MLNKLTVSLSIIILLSILITPVNPVSAQDPLPPTPREPSSPGDAPVVGAQQDENGNWFMPEGARESASSSPDRQIIPATVGGPDEFGYAWDDTIPLSWIDVTSGANFNWTDYSDGKAKLVSLPFSFKFYENTYSQVYIAASGYLSFSPASYWDGQQNIPNLWEPNNVIAPYWSPFKKVSGSWVHYQSGGTAPNRYFVVEWHNVVGSYGTDDKFLFEVVLYENGDTVFQYKNMKYVGNYWCGASGIEDSTGAEGLSYTNFCNQMPSNKAVRFYRPAPAARVKITPMDQGNFTQAGNTESFKINIRNTGDLGVDTFDLTTLTSAWPVTLYAVDGTTLLTDTDADTVVDTDSISPGESIDIIAKINVPSNAQIGDDSLVKITATSSLNVSKYKTASLSMAVPAGFLNVFEDEDDGAMSFVTASPVGTSTYKATADNYWGNSPAVAKIAEGKYLYAWSDYFYTSGHWGYNIEYAIVGANGGNIRPITKLTNNSAAAWKTYDYSPSIAVTPDGTIGILWYRQKYNSSTYKYNFNIYYAALDSSGNLLTGPTNITINTNSGAYWNTLRFNDPQIAATEDNRFVLAWAKYDPINDLEDIYYMVMDTAGGVVSVVTKLTNDTSGDSGYIQPRLASLISSRAMLSWMSRQDGNDDIHYAVLASNGSIFKSETDLSVDEAVIDWTNGDVVQLPSGNILVVWEAWGCFPGDWTSSLRYITLDSSFNSIGTPQCITKAPGAIGESAVSATVGGVDSGVLTWTDNDRLNLYYALINGNGTVLTEPTIFHKSKSYIGVNYNGQGNAPSTTPLISGNVGMAGTTLSYVNGIQRTVIADGSGDYSIEVPNGWSGTVVPYETGYRFTPPSRFYGNTQNDQTDQNYTPEVCAVCVSAILRADPNPTGTGNVNFTVMFSDTVTGVDVGDFFLTTTDVTSAAITDVSGSGTTYIVTVDTGSGNGTIRLDVVDDDSIKDASDNPLGGVGIGNGDFTSGETYDINKEKILNGSFETYPVGKKIPTNWKAVNFSTTDGKVTTVKQEGTASVRIIGTGVSKTLSQTLLLSGSTGDAFNFSFWVNGKSIPTAGVCRAQVLFYNGTTLNPIKPTINCLKGTYGFTQMTLDFNAPGDYTKIIVRFTYSKASGTAWFDAVSLSK